MSSKDELDETYEALQKRIETIEKEVWNRKGFYTRMTAVNDFKKKAEKKKEAVPKYAESLVKLETQVKKAEKDNAEWIETRGDLSGLIRAFRHQLEAEDYPSHVSSLKTSVMSLEKSLKEYELDETTFLLGKYIGITGVGSLRKKLLTFMEKVKKAKNTPKWKSVKADKAKAGRFVKNTEKVMKEFQPLLIRDKKQEQVEKMSSLLRDLKDACNQDKDEMDIGEAQHLIQQIKKDYPDAGKKKEEPEEPKEMDDFGEELDKRIEKYQENAIVFKHVASDMEIKEFEKGLTLYDIKKSEGLPSDPDKDGFKIIKKSIRDEFDDAYETQSKKKITAALERAEAFFAKLNLNDDASSSSESDDDDEPSSNSHVVDDNKEIEFEEEEDDDSSSSSESDEVPRKRSRDEPLDFMADVVKAMDLAEPEERKRIRTLFENEEKEMFTDLVKAVNTRHTKHYEIVLMRPDGSPEINDHLLHFLRISNSHICQTKEQALERVKLLKLDDISNLNYRIDEISPE